MGGGGGGSGSNSVSTIDKNLLPDYAQPQVEDYLRRSNALSVTAYTPYAGVTYASQNADETDGIAALASRGRNSHTIITKGETTLRDILDGLKYNSNPKISTLYLKRAEAIIQEFEEETLPRIDQAYNLSGNFGSISHNLAHAKAAEMAMSKLADLGLSLYFTDYVAERERQNHAIGVGTQYGTQDVANAELLRQAGLYAREYSHGSLIDAHKRWLDAQEAAVKRLELLGNSIRALVGAHSTKTEPLYLPSTMAQMAGIALAGTSLVAGLYSKTTPNSSPYSGAGTSAPGKWGSGGLNMGGGSMFPSVDKGGQ